ncbi:DUF481 domain-containing protein [Photobacterium angustum]|uniref:DUF481 domain-containing protein n=1 Tax=Photobacterium angustum (strain S14 / CCUG 15956) TaxID=314292 RepID=Q1ZQ58_PHOAS|nr:DUF481 domain-containing protein [Photobacterium angustum]EAS64439.1 hypothetical protein VAS14_01936 [Photobacterium angustum S14]
MKLYYLLPLTTFLCQTAFAAPTTETAEKDPAFDGSAKLGFIYSKTTNTSMSLNSATDLNYKKNNWSNKLSLSSFYTDSTEEEDGVNKYQIALKNEYTMGPHSFTYLSNTYNHDQFGTYRSEYIVSTGLGYKFYDTKTTKLVVGGGPGYRHSRRQADDPDYPNQTEQNMIANAFLRAKKQFTPTFSAGFESNVDYGRSNTAYNLEAFIKNRLIDHIALMLDTQYIYNTEVASDKSNDEVYSTVSITYDF